MSLVTRQDHGRVAVLTLNNPPANGYSHAMHRELDDHVVALRFDEGIDVIVITGAGARFFCAGADIASLASLSPSQKYAFCLHANETLLRLENTPKLVIAALNGHCVGGGLEIALACDLRIGKAGHGKPNLVGLPEVSLGVLPGTGGTQRLTRVLGRSKALQMMVEGRNVPVDEAVSLGLIHGVYATEGWWDAVMAYATSFCAPHKAAGAVGLIKRAVLGGADLSLEGGLALERELQMRLFTAADAKEGLSAFLDKRPASFSGATTSTGLIPAPPRQEPPPPPPPAASAPPPSSASSGGPALDGARLLGGPIKDEVLNLVHRDLVERHLVIPARRVGDTLIVVMANPRSSEALAALAEETGLTIQAVGADEFDVTAAIVRFYRA